MFWGVGWDGVGHAGWGGSCRGGVFHTGVGVRWVIQSGYSEVGYNNRCYFYLSQMQNDTNCCDMSLFKVFLGGS